MNYAQVKAHYFAEDAEFALASEDQVDQLCEELGDDRAQMRWDMLQEELGCLLAEARSEFGF